MKAVEVVGDRSGDTHRFTDQLVERLAAEGTVARVVHRPEGDADGTADEVADGGAQVGVSSSDEAAPAETYEVSPSGWRGPGEAATIDDLLDRLAPRCDYAVVDGDGSTMLPQVVLDGTGDAEDALVAVESPDDAAVESVVSALENVDHYETLESLVDRVKQSPDAQYSGAIATFTGHVREKEDPQDEPTEYLEFERYDEPAARAMAEIEADLEARDGVFEVVLYHKTGVVEAGEAIVHVVVLAAHRAEAFTAVEDGIDRLKAEVPLFKKEVTVSEEFWAHER